MKTQIRSTFRFGLITPLLAATSLLGQVPARFYQGVPAGFDFPAAEKTLLEARDHQNVVAMRTHAWMVFAGITQPSRPDNPDSEAVWETWYRGSEVFAVGPQLQGDHQLSRQFVAPRQFTQRGHAEPQDAGLSLASFTLFNQETKDHIRRHNYHLRSTLDALNASFPANGDPAKRKIEDFDQGAMSIKTAWWPIKGTGLTPMPIWDPAKQQLADPSPSQPPRSWKRMVLVDPTRTQIPAGESTSASFMGKNFPDSHVVPLNAFYHFKITDSAQAAQVAKVSGRTVNVGDFLVLVALHYTTKEIPEWVWATFWWHDAPDAGPYAANRVDATKLKGPWRNYLMDVAYDMETPKEADGKPNACFDPWLEAPIGNGTNSNCMTCHQQSTWERPSFTVTRGGLPPDDPLFRTTTKLDFVWAFIFEPDSPGNQSP